MSACPIRHLSKPLMSCSSQSSIVQEPFPHKYSQKVWWDALNVVAATIPSIISRLTPFLRLFLYSMTSFGNVPLTWPYCSKVWPPRHDNAPSAMDMTRGTITLFKFLYPQLHFWYIYNQQTLELTSSNYTFISKLWVKLLPSKLQYL